MRHPRRRRSWLAGLPVLALLAAACAGVTSAGEGGSGSLSLRISSPMEGAQVSSPFTVDLDANVPLDDPSTGERHVHLCFDGASCGEETEYALVYGDTSEVSDLPPGEHTIEASLRNADHTDAGPSDEITVTIVGGGGAEADSGTDSDGGTGVGFPY
jgi:hypothetical protein